MPDLWTTDPSDPLARFETREAAIADGLRRLFADGSPPGGVDELKLYGVRVTVDSAGRESCEVFLVESTDAADWLQRRR
jgi:hypothetical protein